MQIVTDDCGGQGGKKVDLEKEEEGGGRDGGKERGGILRTERKGGYESCWENRIAKKMVEDLCLLRLRDVSIKKLQARGGCFVILKRHRWSSPSKICGPWREPKQDAAYFMIFWWGPPCQREP